MGCKRPFIERRHPLSRFVPADAAISAWHAAKISAVNSRKEMFLIMKKAIFIVALAMLFSKVAAADTTSFNYSGTAPVNSGSATGSYTTTSEPGWTWSAGWGIINPYTPGSLLVNVADPATSTNSTGNADAFNWAGANLLTIAFSTPVSGVSLEAAVLNDSSSASYVELLAFNGATQIDSALLALDVTGGTFGTLGVSESTLDITSIELIGLDSNQLTSAPGDLNQYAIADITASTPEPGTISMLGSGLLGLAGMLKLKLGRRSA